MLVGSRAMEAATEQLKGAKEEMQRAFEVAGLDCVIGGQGSGAVDILKRQHMQTAQQLTTAAAANIQKVPTHIGRCLHVHTILGRGSAAV